MQWASFILIAYLQKKKKVLSCNDIYSFNLFFIYSFHKIKMHLVKNIS